MMEQLGLDEESDDDEVTALVERAKFGYKTEDGRTFF